MQFSENIYNFKKVSPSESLVSYGASPQVRKDLYLKKSLFSSPYRLENKLLSFLFHMMTSSCTVLAITATGKRFSFFSAAYHTSDRKYHCQHKGSKYNYISHIISGSVQTSVQNLCHFINMLSGNYQRRHKTEHIFSGRNHEKPLFQCLIDNFTYGTSRNHKSLNKTGTSSCGDTYMTGCQIIQLFFQIRSQLLYMLQDLILLKNFKYFIHSRTYKRISSVSGSVISGLQ